MDIETPHRQRIALAVQYVGTNLCGWQRQPNGRTVQGELENAIERVSGKFAVIHGSGRTDSGVHAAAQFAHFDIVSPIPATNWATALNAHLPDDVLVLASAAVTEDWHARFSARWRRYRYTIYTDWQPNLYLRPFSWHFYQEPLDETTMQEALNPLQGRHHLSAFRRSNSKRQHSWVEIQGATCQRNGPIVTIEIQADGFLYGMVRLIVGMLVQVGRKDLSVADFTALWQTERRDLVKHSAPAKGLCFLRAGYEDCPFGEAIWYDRLPGWTLKPTITPV